MIKPMLSIVVGVFAFMQSALVLANTLTVTSLADEFPAATPGTFRYELEHSSAGDTIVFADSIKGGTINMVGVNTANQDTSFVIAHALTIEGNGVTINGGWSGTVGNQDKTGTRIFLTAANQGKTTIRNLNLVNGRGTVWYSTKASYLGGAINAGSPLRLENCRLVNNSTMDWIEYSYTYPDYRGGGAISAETDLELVSCFFGTNSIPNGTGSYGGAIRQIGGSLTAEDTVFDHDYTKTFGGGAIYLARGVTGATFTNCKFLENASSGAGDNGGAIYSEMSAGAMKFFGCALRGGSNGSNSCGGGIRVKNAVEFTAVNCEFSDCNAKLGGVIHGSVSNPLFVNCTFYGNAASTWGSAFEVFSPTYLVNCTIAGSYLYGGNDGITYVSSTFRLLNTVFAYNYYGADSANSGDGYNAGFERICSLYKGTSSVPSIPTYTFATSLADVPTATKLFADYEMVSTRHGDTQDTRANLPATVLMPKLGDDDDAPRVVEIGEDSVLASGGYPVRVNADYSYVEYSADGGSTWTQLIKRAGASTDNLTQITADQRGVPYADGMTPIGAATVAASPVDKVLPQGVIVY